MSQMVKGKRGVVPSTVDGARPTKGEKCGWRSGRKAEPFDGIDCIGSENMMKTGG